LKTKVINEVFLILIEVIYIIERETTDKVIIMRTDNDKGEFSLEFIRRYNKDKIVFEPCLIYKHFINRVSERHIYTTDYKARSLLFNTDLSLKF